MPADLDEPGVGDPANRTRLSWTRTAIAFAAIGAAILKSSPIAGAVVIALSLPIWTVAHRVRHSADGASADGGFALVAGTVVLVAITALVVALFGHSPGISSELSHVR